MKTKILFSAVCAATLLGSSAMAEDDATKADLTTWDGDSDKIVSQEEWATAFDEHGLFDRIDENNNGIFDIEEADEGVLDYDMSMDLDAGGHIEREEFVVGLYDHYDENDDDELDETEFDAFASVDDSPLWMDEEAESAEN